MFGKKQLQFAATDKIDKFTPEVDQLLLAMAKYVMGSEMPAEEWAGSTFVSDEASIFDFFWKKISNCFGTT